jgi:hypothetical protein
VSAFPTQLRWPTVRPIEVNRRLLPTAALLLATSLLAAACSNGADSASRGPVPATSPAHANGLKVCDARQLHVVGRRVNRHKIDNVPVVAATVANRSAARCLQPRPQRLALGAGERAVRVALHNSREVTLRPGVHPFLLIGWARTCAPTTPGRRLHILTVTWRGGASQKVYLPSGWPVLCPHPSVTAYAP